jgi:hypothetical protein
MKPYDAVNLTTIFRFVFISTITSYTVKKLRLIGLSYGEVARHSFTGLLKCKLITCNKSYALCVDCEVLNKYKSGNGFMDYIQILSLLVTGIKSRFHCWM